MIDSSAPTQVALMVANTFDEFCESTPYKELLQSRYKEANIPADLQLYLSEFPDLLNWVLIVEEDLPDTLVLTPVVQRLAEHAPRSSSYILRAEDDLSMVDSSLEDFDLGEDDLLDLELPLLLFFNDEWQLLGQWGPRPQAAEGFLDQWLEQNPQFEALALSEEDADQEVHASLLDRLTYEMRVWYVSQLDHACCKEIHGVLEAIAAELENDVTEYGEETANLGGVEDPATADGEPSLDASGSKTADSKTGDVDSVDVDSIGVDSGSSEMDDSEAGDSKTGDSKSGDSKSGDSKSDEPAENEDEAGAASETESTKPVADNKSSNQRSDRRTNDRRRGNSRRRRKRPPNS